MTRTLQDFSFDKSEYERPTQPWICGRAESGEPCRIGPDETGRCRATFECRPVRKGDGWECARPRQWGGPCAGGPSPDGCCARPIPRCQPVRSMRSKRGHVVLWTCMATVGALAWLLAVPERRARVLLPGPLSGAHSAMETECDKCHQVSLGDTSGWPSAALVSTLGSGVQNLQCQVCHAWGADADRPHSLSARALAGMVVAAERTTGPKRGGSWRLSLAAAIAGGKRSATAPLSCVPCHDEHRGRSHRPAEISDEQCQVCHVRQFDGFAGHPAFADYPLESAVGIHFDHGSHRDHFTERGRDLRNRCDDCHRLTADGAAMAPTGFAASCAECHAAEIHGEGVEDVALNVMSLPGLDTETLRARGIAVGHWAEGLDGIITTTMKLILSAGNESIRRDLDRTQKMDWEDLAAADDEQLAAIARLAWAVKEFYFDLYVEGHGALGARLATALGRASGPGEANLWHGQLPVGLIREGIDEWMPNLLDEVPRHRRGERVESRGDAAGDASHEVDPAIGAAGTEGAPTDAAGDDLLGGGESEPPPDDDLLGGGDPDDLLGGGGQEPAPPGPVREPSPVATLSADEWMIGGGWFREHCVFRYRPTGHGDTFLRSWLDLAGRLSPSAEASADPAWLLFDYFGDPTSAGLCIRCHGVDEVPGSGRVVRWESTSPGSSGRAFVRFDHGPHVRLESRLGCDHCHVASADPPPKVGENPRRGRGFAPIEKSKCAECHQPERVGDSCLTCHQYHARPGYDISGSSPVGSTAGGRAMTDVSSAGR
ncbi:MAG: hypothetical protein HOP29_12845 [Phycisphaerales bacterium]|nr:hypothetical protein [Phycisphaerales bacterium]